MYFKFSLLCIGILILLMVYKIIFRSPSLFYKIQTTNILTSLCLIFLVIYLYSINQVLFIDVAFIYVVINYVGIVALLKYIQTLYNYQNKET